MNRKLSHIYLLMLFTLILSVVSSRTFAQTAWDGTTDYSWYNATGTEFNIYTAEELAGLAALVNGTNGATKTNLAGKKIKLMNDIWLNEDGYSTATAKNWPGIGGQGSGETTSDCVFSGHFDGDYHIIYNLYCNRLITTPQYQAGLFGAIQGTSPTDSAKVENVIVKNAVIKANSAGATIVAFVKGSDPTLVKNCMGINIDIEARNAGGMVSTAYQQSPNLNITNCAVTGGNIRGYNGNNAETGGIGGNLGSAGAKVNNCYFQGTINEGATAGGKIVAHNATVTNCYYTGSGGGNGAGGTIDKTSAEMKSESFWTTNLTAGTFQEDCDINNGYPIVAGYLCNIKIDGPKEICPSASTTLTAVNGFDTYVWSTGATTKSITVSPAQTTTYYVTSTRTEDSFSLTGETTINVLDNFNFTTTVVPSYDGATHGSISPLVESIDCTTPEPILYTITPDEGWLVSRVIIDGVEITNFSPDPDTDVVSGTYTPTAGKHGNITVHFYDKYTITASISLNGEAFTKTSLISPWGTNGVSEVNKGGSLAYTLSQTSIYSIASISINGEPLSQIQTTYTFENVKSNQTIHIDYFVSAVTGIVWNGSWDDTWFDNNETDFYIYTAEQLAGVAKLVNEGTTKFSGKTIHLMADIWLNADGSTDNNWIPIGGSPTATDEMTGGTVQDFSGNFNGNNHLIYNLYVDKGNYYHAGLFGCVTGAGSGTVRTIENLGLINPHVKSRGMMGALIGFFKRWVYGDYYVKNCMVIDATVEAPVADKNNNIAGIVGATYNAYGTIYVQNCAVTGDFSGNFVGGIAGNGTRANISNCYFAGDITSYADSGGITASGGTSTNNYSNYIGSGAEYTEKTEDEMKNSDFLDLLNTDSQNPAFKTDCGLNNGLPIMDWYICAVDITGPTEVCANTSITLTANGYDTYTWTHDKDENFEETGKTITLNIEETTVFTVTGKLNDFPDVEVVTEYTVTVNPAMNINVTIKSYDNGIHGTVNPMTSSIECGNTTPITLAITPETGWHISAIYENGELKRESVYGENGTIDYTYTPKNISVDIEVHFSDLYTVTASMSLNNDNSFNETYLIEPWGKNGITSYTAGEDLVYIINETGKYHVNDVIVNGNSLGKIHTYTFSDLDKDGQTIHVDFTEDCGIVSLPYAEKFDFYGTGSGIMPDCWDKAGTGNAPGTHIYTTYKSAPGSLGISVDPGSTAIIVLPEFKVEDVNINAIQATFKIYSGSTDPELKVGMANPITYEFEEVSSINPEILNEWDEFDVFFNNYNGEYKHIAFSLTTPTSSLVAHTVYIDDLEIDISPSCLKPFNLVIENIESSSVTLSWESDPSVSEWEFAIGPKDFTPTSGIMVYSNIHFEKGNLTPLTNYDIYIKAVCSEDEESKWSKVKSFKTTQKIGTIPFECNFENDSENASWDLRNYQTIINKWYIGNAVNSGNNGSKSLYISDDNGVSNHFSTFTYAEAGNQYYSYVYAVRTISINKTGTYNYSYDWKNKGTASNYLKAFLVPEDVQIIAGSANGIGTNTTPSGWINLYGTEVLQGQTEWQTKSGSFDITESGKYNLVFLWYSYYSSGTDVNQPPVAVDNISITRVAVEYPISQIDPNNTIRNKQFNVCAGMTLQQVKETLPKQVPITDTNNRTHNAEVILWTISGYDPDDTETTFNAKATFVLPDDVIQTPTPTALEVDCYVKVNALPAVTCPTNINATTINNPVTLSGASPAGGTFSGTAVTNDVFNPENLKPADYTITYSYTDANTECSSSCSFVIKVTYPYVDVIDPENDFPLTVNTCLGSSEDIVKSQLPQSVKIKDSDEIIHTPRLTWSITGYDPQTEGTYEAKGTFRLPATVVQSESAKDLWVTASVKLNELPDLTCPDSDIKLMTNESLVLDVATPEGGTYSGDGVSNGIFNNSKNIIPGTYVITYEYTHPQTSCSSYCSFNIIVSQPYIKEVDVDEDAVNIKVCLGTEESVAKDKLVKQIKISDSNDNTYTVNLSWTIDSYNPNNEGEYEATGTFSLPTGIVQSDPETPLNITVNVEVVELPDVDCPEDMNVEPNSITDLAALTGVNPNGGKYSGINVKDGKFDATGLSSGEYTITYTYTDEETGCSNNCSFTITISKVGIEPEHSDNINIYPNPSNGNFKIDLGIYDGKASYQILDTKGSLVKEEILDNSIKELSLDIEAGIYYIKIFVDNNYIVKKLIIE